MIITGNFNNDYHNNQNVTYPYIVHVVVIKLILYQGTCMYMYIYM